MTARRLGPDALIALGLYLAIASIYVLSHSGRLDMIDAQFKFDTTWSILTHGDVQLRDRALLSVLGRPDPPYAPYTLAASVTGLPLALFGRLLDPDSRELAQFAWALTPALLGAVTIPLLFVIWRALGIARRSAAAWALAVGFGSLLWTSAASSFDQAPQAALLLGAVWLSRQAVARGSVRDASMAGAAFGVIVHYQAAFVLLGVPLGLALVRWPLRRPWWPAVRLATAFAAGVAPFIALLLVSNALRFGSPFRLSSAPTGIPLFDNPALGAAVLLVSPGKSVFLYSPIVVLALFGLKGLLRVDRSLVVIAAVTTLSHLLLVSSLSFPGGDWCWGPRYLVLTVPLVCLAIPWCTAVPSAARGAIVAVSAAIQVLGLTLDHQRFFFDRALAPHFWLHNQRFYLAHSALFARWSELTAPVPEGFARFSSGPSPLLTYSPFGPPPWISGPDWVRQFAVFHWPRPWPLWVARLPDDLRPFEPFPFALALASLALVGFALALRGVRHTS